jgi:transcriptional regulator with XRE-family HTH domain
MNGKELRTIRESMRMTQFDLGRHFGVDRSRISQVEGSAGEIEPTWALAIDNLRYRVQPTPGPEALADVALTALRLGGSPAAVVAIVEHVPGLLDLDGDRELCRAADRSRDRYVAGRIVEIHAARAQGLAESEMWRHIALADAQTDAAFWVATDTVGQLDRTVSEYLDGRRSLKADAPEIVSITRETVEELHLTEPLLVDRYVRWTVTARGWGRNVGLDHLTTLTYDRVRSEALVRAYACSEGFADLANYRAGD